MFKWRDHITAIIIIIIAIALVAAFASCPYLGSLFSLSTVVLLALSLLMQFRSSLRKDFSEKYFQMLALHRKNLEEIKLFDGIQGRKAFVRFMEEFRKAHEVVTGVATKHGLNPESVMQIAYYIFYFGVGDNSDRMLKEALLDRRIKGIDSGVINEIICEAHARRSREVSKKNVKKNVIFDGHQHRLGHYYRHLYQLVKFIDSNATVLSKKEKYDYARTVRAQLSNQEQALLLLNSFTPLGQEWWKEAGGNDSDFLTRYHLVKNIPKAFFEKTELDISKLFPSKYFEWQEDDKGNSKKPNPEAFAVNNAAEK